MSHLDAVRLPEVRGHASCADALGPVRRGAQRELREQRQRLDFERTGNAVDASTAKTIVLHK